jgi:predicted XRE-type DNA-binding protein
MGEDQARVSDLTRGDLARFSVGKLIDCLLSLGRDLHVDIPSEFERSEEG